MVVLVHAFRPPQAMQEEAMGRMDVRMVKIMQVESEHMEIPLQHYTAMWSAWSCGTLLQRACLRTTSVDSWGPDQGSKFLEYVKVDLWGPEQGRNFRGYVKVMEWDSVDRMAGRDLELVKNESKYMEIPVQHFNLTQFLYEEKQMVGFNIQKESTLYLVLRLRGGMLNLMKALTGKLTTLDVVASDTSKGWFDDANLDGDGEADEEE